MLMGHLSSIISFETALSFQNTYKFKMVTYLQSLRSSFEIKDHQGKPLAAIDVFSKSLKYMAGEFYKMLKKNENTDYEKIKDKTRWIVTVPAIWTDESKRFVRDAAEKVTIHLRLNIYFIHIT